MDSSEVAARLESLERRLSNLELKLGYTATDPKPEQPPAPQASFTPPGTPKPISIAEWEAEPYSRKESISIKPGQWLGIIAIVCFVLAAGFMIKLSIESGWLTPERQVGTAFLFGLALIGSGLFLMEKDRAYASLLPGAGVIVLYLTVFGAHRWYSLIGFELSILMIGGVSGICIWLYQRLKHDLYAVVAGIGAYATPVLFDMNAQAEFTLYYYVLCSVTFASISIYVESRTLTLVASYMAILMTWAIGQDLNNDVFVACILPLHFLIFSFGTYLHTVNTDKFLEEQEAFSFLPVMLLFYGFEYFFLNLIAPDLAPWYSLIFAAVLLGLYFAARKMYPGQRLASGSVVLAFTAVVFFHSVYLELMTSDVRQGLAIAFLLAFSFLPVSTQPQDREFKVVRLAVLIMTVVGVGSTAVDLALQPDTNALIFGFATLAGLWAVITVGRKNLGGRIDAHNPILFAAHVLAVLSLYQLTKDIGSLAVSISWLAYAAAVIFAAFAMRDEVMAKSAVIVLGFSAAKALLYDVSSAPSIVRIACLLLTGAVLYGAGFLLRQISTWKSSAR